VLVLNMRAETLKEQVAVGLAQAKVLADIRDAARGTAHRVGIYYTVPASKDGKEPERATYIHSKLMIVDDRFLNVGSANLTNRSASVDTELNATFEADHDDALRGRIERFRLGLLAEHLGEPERAMSFDQGRVASLDDRATRRDGRLRQHPSPTERERQVLDVVDPQALPFDPHAIEEDEEDRSLFARGVGTLWRRLLSNRDDRK
jgi:phosphatidylserine/phosphatidylglycerophosphate/cardiolipin synthase-like enzyme